MKSVFNYRTEDGEHIIVYNNNSNKNDSVMDKPSVSNEETSSSDDDQLNEPLSTVKHKQGTMPEPKLKLSRPPSAFGLFYRDYEKVLKINRPSITTAELQKMAMAKWEAMEPPSKQRYIDENSRLKVEYDNTLTALEQSGTKSGLPARTCRGFGCSKPAVDNKLWDRDFCGSQCVVNYCRSVFSTWVADQQKNF